MTFEEIKKEEAEYLMPTYGRFPVALAEGKGAVAKDVDGKEYIDFTSGIGVNCLGYSDDGLVKAISEQAGKIQHMSNLYYNPLQVEVAKKLVELTGLSKVFFCNSGAEANECAIKVARKYAFEKYSGKRNKIITLVNSFHGRTVTTLAATGQDVFHNYFFPFTEGFEYAEANNIESLRNLIDDTVCAVFIELIQGEGGVNPLQKPFVWETAKICQDNDILLMIDEVQTGVARTGTFYCYEQYGVTPDIITTAKGLGGGLPFGACICSEKLSGVLSAGTHGTTFGGNPVACAASLEVLSRVATKEFLKEVSEKGAYIKEKLSSMPNVKEVRGLGMMIGIVLEKGEAKVLANRCVEKGLLILTAKTLLRLLPPLNLADQLKYEQKHNIEHKYLKGKTLGLIFEKASTRTRVSFEVGMYQLGGLPAHDMQIGRGEPVQDTARVLSRYLDGIMIRTFKQSEVEDLAKYGSIPIINGLTDFCHPCQILADLMTIREYKGKLAGQKMAFIGDGNNMMNSLIVGALKMEMSISVACPEGYEPDPLVLEFAKGFGDKFEMVREPKKAVVGADVVITDVWASMGQEGEAEKRKKAFAGYCIDEELMSYAKPDAIVQHCLPAHRGEEISADVFEAHAAEIFDEAENRLHAQKAVIVKCLTDK